MAFNAKINLGVEWRQEKSQDLTTVHESIVKDFSTLFEEGTGGAGEANAVWSTRFSVTGGGFDLNTLTDSLGRSLNFVKVKAVIFKCISITVPGNNMICLFADGTTEMNLGSELTAAGAVAVWHSSAGVACNSDAYVSATCTGGGVCDIYIIGTK